MLACFIWVGARMSIPKMSIPKMSIPIMSTVPNCLFPLCLLCQNVYSPQKYINLWKEKLYSIPVELASVRVCVRSIQNNLMAFTIYCHYIANFMVSKKLLAHLSRRLTR